MREQNKIGSGLEAEVTIYCDGYTSEVLSLLENELRFVLITSAANRLPISAANENSESFKLQNGDNIKIEVTKSSHAKCVRCWHLRADVGNDKNHPDLCTRCIENVDGLGETRKYA